MPNRFKLRQVLGLLLPLALFVFNSCTRTFPEAPPPFADLSSSGSFALSFDKNYGSNGCQSAGKNTKFFKWSNGFYLSGVNSISKFFSNGQLDLAWAESGNANVSALQTELGSNEAFELFHVDGLGHLLLATKSKLCRLNSDLTLDTSFQRSGAERPGCVPASIQTADYQFARVSADSSGNYWIVRIQSNHLFVDGVGSAGEFLGTYDLGIQSPTSFGFTLTDVVIAQEYVHIIFNSVDTLNLEITNWITFNLVNQAMVQRASDQLKRRLNSDSMGRLIETEYDPGLMLGAIQIEAADGTNSLSTTSMSNVASELSAESMPDAGALIMTGYRRPSGTSTGISIIRIDQFGTILGRFNAGVDLGLPSKCDDSSYCRGEFLDLINQGVQSFVLASGSDEISMLCRFNTP